MELCKIYSGKSRKYQIKVIDKNFYSSRVSQLKRCKQKKDILLELLILNIFDDHIFKSHSISKLNSYDHESGSLF